MSDIEPLYPESSHGVVPRRIATPRNVPSCGAAQRMAGRGNATQLEEGGIRGGRFNLRRIPTPRETALRGTPLRYAARRKATRLGEEELNDEDSHSAP